MLAVSPKPQHLLIRCEFSLRTRSSRIWRAYIEDTSCGISSESPGEVFARAREAYPDAFITVRSGDLR